MSDRLTAALEALLARAIESLHDAERELHVWVDRDRVRHPGWSDVGYEPWNNKPSLALWAVEVSEIERDAAALAAPAPTPSEPVARWTLVPGEDDDCPRCGRAKVRIVQPEYEPGGALCDECGWDSRDTPGARDE